MFYAPLIIERCPDGSECTFYLNDKHELTFAETTIEWLTDWTEADALGRLYAEHPDSASYWYHLVIAHLLEEV